MSVVPRYLTEVTHAIGAEPKLMDSLTNLDNGHFSYCRTVGFAGIKLHGD